MITRSMVEKILEFVREPGINGYGKWGSLNVEQRKLVRELCKSWIIYDNATNEQTKEIERLNKEIESWIKLIDYKGIEDIPQYVSDLEVDNKQLKEENQLLNKNYNIINELEKWLNEEYDATIFDYRNAIEDVLDKLQELKGSSNNE